MITYTTFDNSTGLLGAQIGGSRRVLSMSMGKGFYVRGAHNKNLKKVDLERFHSIGSPRICDESVLIDHRSDRPSADFEWDDSGGEWVIKPEIASAFAAIQSLESIQLRAVREALLGQGTERLATIEAQIVEQRAIINASRQS